MKVWHTLRYQFRRPLVLLIHFALWGLFFFLIEGTTYNNIYNYLETLINELHLILILCFISSYRLTRGKLNGIANKQQEWMKWYDNQEQEIPKHHKYLPQSLSECLKLSFVLTTLKNIVLAICRNPILFVFHFICWHYVLFLGPLLADPMQYTIRESQNIGISRIFENVMADMSHDYIYGFLAIAIFAIITYIQEVIGKLRGSVQEHQQWLKWHENYNESLPKQNNLNETPSLISNESGLLFVKRQPIYTILYVSIVMVLFFFIGIQLILITEWSGIKFLGWIALPLLLLR